MVELEELEPTGSEAIAAMLVFVVRMSAFVFYAKENIRITIRSNR
jgi:hypothetical protein